MANIENQKTRLLGICSFVLAADGINILCWLQAAHQACHDICAIFSLIYKNQIILAKARCFYIFDNIRFKCSYDCSCFKSDILQLFEKLRAVCSFLDTRPRATFEKKATNADVN